MFRKSILALAAVAAIAGGASLGASDAEAGWKGKGKIFHGHVFNPYWGMNAHTPHCGYVYTKKGFLKYVCF